MDQNEEIFVRFMNDAAFQRVVTAWMADEAYRRFRSGKESNDSRRARPRVVEGRPDLHYVTAVPLVPLEAAAGAFGDPQHVADGDFQWVEVGSSRKLHPGMFVARVTGRSMEPTIPDGAYCLFRAPVEGTRQGKTVLVELRDRRDAETGERYTVKRYESEKSANGDSWRHDRITLKPLNSEFQPIALAGTDEGELKVIAELVDVLENLERE
jgi:phage repressor protein C with HTH and peptisase S24 domain